MRLKSFLLCAVAVIATAPSSALIAQAGSSTSAPATASQPAPQPEPAPEPAPASAPTTTPAPAPGQSGAVKAPQNVAARGTDPRTEILTRERGLAKADAEAQLALTDKFEKEIAALSGKFAGNYLTSIIEYGKPLTITVVLDRDVELGEVRQSVSADLRQYIRTSGAG